MVALQVLWVGAPLTAYLYPVPRQHEMGRPPTTRTDNLVKVAGNR